MNDPSRRLELDAFRGRPDVLVIVALASGKVLAETGVAEPCRRNPYAQGIGEGRGGAADSIELAMRTDIGAQADMRPVGRGCGVSHI